MSKIFNKILLFMDGSDNSIDAAEFTIELSVIHSSIVIAINIIDPKIITQLSKFENKTYGEIEIKMEENGWKYLYYFEEMALEKKVKSYIELETGNPSDKTIYFAKKYGVDLIVLPKISKSGGTQGIAQLKFYQQIIEYAPCSVLIV